MRLESELVNWSDHVINWLLTEEAISHQMRSFLHLELSRRSVEPCGGSAVEPVEDVEVVLDKRNIHALFNNGSPNSRQRNTLGLGWPLKAGWVERLVGRKISAQLYDELLTCKGSRPKGWPKADWRKSIKEE